MIASISHINNSSGFQSKINYNEDKVEKGVAKLIFDNTLSSDKNDRISSFLEVKSLNNHVKNMAFEVSINLPPGENLPEKEFNNLIQDYVQGLGYEDVPMIAYQHSDARHNHVHIFISHVDWEGKKIKQFNSFYKSQRLSRELEVKYNLRKTEYKFNVTNESLQSKNHRKYYIQNAIKKGLRAYNTKKFLTDQFSPEEIQKLNIRKYDNEQMSILLGGKEKDIMHFLEKHKMFNVLFKDELYKKVDNVFKEYSETPKEYVNQLIKEGVYVRKLYDNGKPYLVYGLKDVSFYMEDKKLARKFMYSSLMGEEPAREKNIEGKEFDTKKQKNFLKNMVGKSLYTARSLEGFSKNLKENNIELITYQNKRGIYGVAFKSIEIENAEVIKGSDIDISWNDIKQQIDENKAEIAVEMQEEIQEFEDFEEIQYVPHFPEKGISNHKDEEDYLTIRRKGRRKKGMSR